jgi:hypothetical protein
MQLRPSPLFARVLTVGIAVLFAQTVSAQTPSTAPQAPIDTSGGLTVVRPPTVVREVLAAPLRAAQEMIAQQKFAEALLKLKEVQAIADRTAEENYLVERTRITAAQGAKDSAALIDAIRAAEATGQVPADEKPSFYEVAAVNAYNSKQYPTAIEFAKRYTAIKPINPSMRQVLAMGSYLNNDFAAAREYTQPMVQEALDAKRPPEKIHLELLATVQNKLKDDEGYFNSLSLIVMHYPTPANWSELLARLERRPGFAERLALDSYRLQLYADVLANAEEYLDYAQLAMAAGLPTEADIVLKAATAKGLMAKGADGEKQKKLAAQAAKQAAEDKAAMTAADPKPKGNDTTTLLNEGYNMYLAGQTERGLGLMERSIAGTLKFPDDARLRLAGAYARAGNKAKAQEWLAQVKGSDGSAALAKWWGVLLDQRK